MDTATLTDCVNRNIGRNKATLLADVKHITLYMDRAHLTVRRVAQEQYTASLHGYGRETDRVDDAALQFGKSGQAECNSMGLKAERRFQNEAEQFRAEHGIAFERQLIDFQRPTGAGQPLFHPYARLVCRGTPRFVRTRAWFGSK